MCKHEWLYMSLGPYTMRLCKSCDAKEIEPKEEGKWSSANDNTV